MRLFRKVVVLFAVVISMASVVNFIEPSTASAAICRSGYDCTDPNVKCAGNAKSPRGSFFVANMGFVEFRYSNTCRTVWTRSQLINGWTGFDQGSFMARTNDNAGRLYTDTLSLPLYANGSYKWTRQLNDIGLNGYGCGWDPGQVRWLCSDPTY